MSAPPLTAVLSPLDSTHFWQKSDGGRAQSYAFLEVFTGPPVTPLLSQAGLTKMSEPGATEVNVSPANVTPFVILENACGTGVVASVLFGPSPSNETIHKNKNELREIVCGDLSPQMVDLTKSRSQRGGWEKGGTVKVRVEVINAQETGMPDGYFTHVLTNFGMMLFPDPVRALKDHFRILKPGGTVAFTTWNLLGWHPYLQRATSRVPSCPPLLTPFSLWRRGTSASDSSESSSATPPFSPQTNLWDSTEWISTLLPSLGYTDVTVTPFRFESKILGKENRDAFVKSCQELLIPLFASQWTEEQKKEIPSVARELENLLKEEFGDPADGKAGVTIPSIAIVSSGRKPL